MSQENVDIVRRFEELMTGEAPADADSAFDADRLEQGLALLSDDVVFRPFAGMPGHGGDWTGIEGIRKMFEAYGTAWEAPEGIQFKYWDCGGDTVLLHATFDSKSKITGKTVPVRMVEVITVKDGKITELVPFYHDGNRIVETAGGPKTAVAG